MKFVHTKTWCLLVRRAVAESLTDMFMKGSLSMVIQRAWVTGYKKKYTHTESAQVILSQTFLIQAHPLRERSTSEVLIGNYSTPLDV